MLEYRFDEALVELEKFSEDSPRYHYNRMICEYGLLMKEDGLKSAKKLLSFNDMPDRYRAMGRIIQHDLEEMVPDSLGHVAKLMKDSERRLGLGQGGPKVQKRQAEVIAILDYLIEKAEGSNKVADCPCEQSGSPKNESDNPADQSSVKGSKAAGEADRKRIANKYGWGSLPPKEQAAAKQYIDEHFPPHYRRIIEEYTKRMAERDRRR